MIINYSCIKISTTITYPHTRTVNQIDDYFGTQVSNPYRWVEDLDSKKVLTWAYSQQDVTRKYLNKIPFTNKISDMIKSI